MFSQPPDDEPNYSKIVKSTPQSRRQKKLRRKNRLKAIKKDQFMTKKDTRTPVSITPVPATMSSWAENFAKAATWQLKHQVAYWKSKAIALEYENQILRHTMRTNTLKLKSLVFSIDTTDSEDEPEENDDEKLEVSEEYIQFLRDNKVYRDDARQERERMRALYDVEKKNIEEMEAGPALNLEDPKKVLKRLYGDGWEKISALETCLQSQFINICDRDKPMYWPNVPFNFNYDRKH